jgi:uncharacterized protein (TIGR03790 family)
MPSNHWLPTLVFTLAACAGCAEKIEARVEPSPEARRVMVVMNPTSADSLSLARHYMERRGIPPENGVLARTPDVEEISRSEFEDQILKPVREILGRNANGIDFIVLMRGVPIRIREGGHSVDGQLAGMDLASRTFDGPEGSKMEFLPNPYFNRNESFSRAKYGMFLVTRLDGYSLSDARRLVDTASLARRSTGPFLFDMADNRKDGSYGQMQETLQRADAILRAKGLTSILDRTAEFAAPSESLAGYASWGSNDAAFDAEAYRRLRFQPGAIAETFVSTSGRTFRRTTGGQSLIADLIANGITGVKGYVSEPYTFALVKPDILFDRYTSGFNLAESFYMASPVIKWKDVVIGDPLCAPYRK